MKRLNKLLFRSFDAELTSEEKKELENALSSLKEFKQEKHLMEQIRKKVSCIGTDSFRLGFAERVISNLNKNDVLWFDIRPFDLVSVFKPVMISAGFVVIGLLIYQFSMGNITSINSLLNIPEYTVENFAYAIQ